MQRQKKITEQKYTIQVIQKQESESESSFEEVSESHEESQELDSI
jgi:hypothetical protein